MFVYLQEFPDVVVVMKQVALQRIKKLDIGECLKQTDGEVHGIQEQSDLRQLNSFFRRAITSKQTLMEGHQRLYGVDGQRRRRTGDLLRRGGSHGSVGLSSSSDSEEQRTNRPPIRRAVSQSGVDHIDSWGDTTSSSDDDDDSDYDVIVPADPGTTRADSLEPQKPTPARIARQNSKAASRAKASSTVVEPPAPEPVPEPVPETHPDDAQLLKHDSLGGVDRHKHSGPKAKPNFTLTAGERGDDSSSSEDDADAEVREAGISESPASPIVSPLVRVRGGGKRPAWGGGDILEDMRALEASLQRQRARKGRKKVPHHQRTSSEQQQRPSTTRPRSHRDGPAVSRLKAHPGSSDLPRGTSTASNRSRRLERRSATPTALDLGSMESDLGAKPIAQQSSGGGTGPTHRVGASSTKGPRTSRALDTETDRSSAAATVASGLGIELTRFGSGEGQERKSNGSFGLPHITAASLSSAKAVHRRGHSSRGASSAEWTTSPLPAGADPARDPVQSVPADGFAREARQGSTAAFLDSLDMSDTLGSHRARLGRRLMASPAGPTTPLWTIPPDQSYVPPPHIRHAISSHEVQRDRGLPPTGGGLNRRADSERIPGGTSTHNTLPAEIAHEMVAQLEAEYVHRTMGPRSHHRSRHHHGHSQRGSRAGGRRRAGSDAAVEGHAAPAILPAGVTEDVLSQHSSLSDLFTPRLASSPSGTPTPSSSALSGSPGTHTAVTSAGAPATDVTEVKECKPVSGYRPPQPDRTVPHTTTATAAAFAAASIPTTGRARRWSLQDESALMARGGLDMGAFRHGRQRSLQRVQAKRAGLPARRWRVGAGLQAELIGAMRQAALTSVSKRYAPRLDADGTAGPVRRNARRLLRRRRSVVSLVQRQLARLDDAELVMRYAHRFRRTLSTSRIPREKHLLSVDQHDRALEASLHAAFSTADTHDPMERHAQLRPHSVCTSGARDFESGGLFSGMAASTQTSTHTARLDPTSTSVGGGLGGGNGSS